MAPEVTVPTTAGCPASAFGTLMTARPFSVEVRARHRCRTPTERDGGFSRVFGPSLRARALMSHEAGRVRTNGVRNIRQALASPHPALYFTGSARPAKAVS
jgi:hypothetical protein